LGMKPHGFDCQFTLLFDDDTREQPHLPEPIRAIYQGDWHPLSHPDRPYTFMNFVTSRDGRVSYNEPGHVSGANVACFNTADIWLMGMLRARADAIMMGEGTLHSAPQELWTYDAIFPAEREAFGAMRGYFGLPPVPLHIFVSLDGTLDASAAVFHQPELKIIIATTRHGQSEASARLRNCTAAIEILDLGAVIVDFAALAHLLFDRYGVRLLLCEGGPRVYGSLLRAGLVDDEFLTLSPTMVGEEPGKFRPSLIEGVAFAPGMAPRSQLLSMRRTGDHLFLRSRWSYHQAD
jgi:riboflavin biosynthesis pyrimidine reductase